MDSPGPFACEASDLSMPLKYQSGIDVRKGDRVTYHGEPGEIELVKGLAGDPGTDWLVDEFGPGVMVLEPKVFGRVYVSPVEDDEHLVFVSRHEGKLIVRPGTPW